MDRVLVLLSTFNGEKFLQEQLNSLYAQKNVCVDVFVRDDGSSDGTKDILKKNAENKMLTFYTGEHVGIGQSFLDLVKKADGYDYYALCDQDDVWLDDKLLVATQKLKKEDQKQPLLYCSSTTLVNEKLEKLKQKIEPKFKLTFAESLVQDVANGCTFVFNSKLKEIVTQVSFEKFENFMHDKLIYNIAANSGNILYDYNSHILHRQHCNNNYGKTGKPFVRLKNGLKKLFIKRYQNAWSNQAKCLANYKDILTEQNKKDLELLLTYKRNFKSKNKLLWHKNIKRPKRFENIWLFFAILFNAV